jgi:hypothetical protein
MIIRAPRAIPNRNRLGFSDRGSTVFITPRTICLVPINPPKMSLILFIG